MTRQTNEAVDRRSMLKWVGAGSLVGLAGCAGQQTAPEGDGTDDTGEDRGETEATTEQAAGKTGGHLRLSVSRKAQTLNPIQHVNAPEYMTTSWMYSKLTRINNDLELIPDLATDWEATNDTTEWIFNLREGVTFHHNDEQVTAEDVKATLEMIQDPDVGSPGKGAIGPIDHVEVDDELTARVVLTGPYADIPKKMAKQFCCIVPKNVIENRFDELANNDFGSGPFILENYEVGSEIKLSRYEDFYLEDEEGNQLPYFDELTQTLYPEFVSERTAFGNQDVDVMFEVPPANWNQVQNMSGVDTVQATGGSFLNVVMRSDQPPFDDNRVRRAFKHAVDKQKMLEGVINGQGVVAQDTPISPAYTFHTELSEREHDLDKAKSLLEEAGHGDGLEMKIYAANDPQIRVDYAVLLKEQLAPIGVNLEVEQISYDRYLSQVWKQAPLYMGFYGMRYVADGILYLLLHSEGSWNEAHWTDDEFNQALEDARRTTDQQERQDLYAKAQEILWERGPYLVSFFQNLHGAKQSYVQNYQKDPTGFYTNYVEYSDPAASTYLTTEAPTRG